MTVLRTSTGNRELMTLISYSKNSTTPRSFQKNGSRMQWWTPFLLLVFLLFSGFLFPSFTFAQAIDPDAVVVEFMTGDGAHHTRTMNQIIADIKSKDENQSYHSLMQLDNLNKMQFKYALSKLPSAVDLATGEVNWIIIRALEKMKKVGRDRLSREMLSILSHGKEGNVFLAVQKTRLIHGHRDQVINELSRVFMNQDYSKTTRQYAASSLFRQDAAAHARIIENIESLAQKKDRQTRLYAFEQIRTKYNYPKISVKMNEKIIELLKTGLNDEYSMIRHTAVVKLLHAGGKAEYTASKYIVENIMHGNDLWKINTAYERLGEYSKIELYREVAVSALELFRKYLRNGNHKQKEYAIQGLTLMAKYAQGAKNDLKKIINGGDSELARQAKVALECLDEIQCDTYSHGHGDKWYSVNP
jgi:hypothetical protein